MLFGCRMVEQQPLLLPMLPMLLLLLPAACLAQSGDGDTDLGETNYGSNTRHLHFIAHTHCPTSPLGVGKMKQMKMMSFEKGSKC